MANTTGIEIVITGKDGFSTVFDRLNGALEGSEKSGRKLEEAMGVLDARLAEQAQLRLASSEELSIRLEEGERRLGENLLLVDEDNTLARQDLALASREEELAGMAGHHQQVESLEAAHQERLLAVRKSGVEKRLELARTLFGSLAVLAETQGRSMAQAAKSLAVAEAIISTYLAANKAMAQVPYPFNLVAAAAVVAKGMANVQEIQQVNTAHGGLDAVPDDATYLLKRGERVLSPTQNRDLTRFLTGESKGGGVTVQNLTIHVLENARDGQALMNMEPQLLRQLVAEKFIPALNGLALMGIKPDLRQEG